MGQKKLKPSRGEDLRRALEPPVEVVDTEAIVKSECEKALTSLRRGNPQKAVKIVKEVTLRYCTVAIGHRVNGHLHMKLSNTIEDATTKRKHFKAALDAAKQATLLSPNSVEYAYFLSQLLYDDANDAKGYEEVVKECERALAVEDPVDPAKEALQDEGQQDLPTPEARIANMQQELRSMVSKANIASLSTWMKTFGQANGEDRMRVLQVRKHAEDPVEQRVPPLKRIHEVKKVVKSAEERRQEIEVRVAAARLLQQRNEGGESGQAEVEEVVKEQEKKRVVGRKSQGGGGRRPKLLGSEEKIERVKQFWKSMSDEQRAELLSISVTDLKASFPTLAGPTKCAQMLEVFEGAMKCAQEQKLWRFWGCCLCNDTFPTEEEHNGHVLGEHVGRLTHKQQKMLPQSELDSDWSEVLLEEDAKAIDAVPALNQLIASLTKGKEGAGADSLSDSSASSSRSGSVEQLTDLASLPAAEESVCMDTDAEGMKVPHCCDSDCQRKESGGLHGLPVVDGRGKEDEERQGLLDRAIAIMRALMKGKLMTMDHVLKVVHYAMEEIQKLIPERGVQYVFSPSPMYIRFLGVQQLATVCKFLSDLAVQSGMEKGADGQLQLQLQVEVVVEEAIPERLLLNEEFTQLQIDERILKVVSPLPLTLEEMEEKVEREWALTKKLQQEEEKKGEGGGVAEAGGGEGDEVGKDGPREEVGGEVGKGGGRLVKLRDVEMSPEKKRSFLEKHQVEDESLRRALPLMKRKGKGKEEVPHEEQQLLWVYGKMEYETQPGAWKSMQAECVQKAREVVELVRKEFVGIQELCTRKRELAKVLAGMATIEKWLVAETKKNATVEKGGEKVGFAKLLRQKLQAAAEERREEEEGGSSKDKGLLTALEAVNKELKSSQWVQSHMYGYDVLSNQSPSEEEEDEDERIRVLSRKNFRVERIVSSQKEQAAQEVNGMDVRLVQAVENLNKHEACLSQATVFDFRAVVMPIIKAYLQHRVEGAMDRDARQKSDAAQERFLAELAKDELAKPAEGKGGGKEKSKDKKKGRDAKKVVKKSFPGSSGGEAAAASEDGEGEGEYEVSEVSEEARWQVEEDARQAQVAAEERQLAQVLEHQRRVEEQAKLHRLAQIEAGESRSTTSALSHRTGEAQWSACEEEETFLRHLAAAQEESLEESRVAEAGGHVWPSRLGMEVPKQDSWQAGGQEEEPAAKVVPGGAGVEKVEPQVPPPVKAAPRPEGGRQNWPQGRVRGGGPATPSSSLGPVPTTKPLPPNANFQKLPLLPKPQLLPGQAGHNAPFRPQQGRGENGVVGSKPRAKPKRRERRGGGGGGGEGGAGEGGGGGGGGVGGPGGRGLAKEERMNHPASPAGARGVGEGGQERITPPPATSTNPADRSQFPPLHGRMGGGVGAQGLGLLLDPRGSSLQPPRIPPMPQPPQPPQPPQGVEGGDLEEFDVASLLKTLLPHDARPVTLHPSPLLPMAQMPFTLPRPMPTQPLSNGHAAGLGHRGAPGGAVHVPPAAFQQQPGVSTPFPAGSVPVAMQAGLHTPPTVTRPMTAGGVPSIPPPPKTPATPHPATPPQTWAAMAAKSRPPTPLTSTSPQPERVGGGKKPESVAVPETPLRAETVGGELPECAEAEEGGGKGYGEEEEEQYEAELEEVLRRSLDETKLRPGSYQHSNGGECQLSLDAPSTPEAGVGEEAGTGLKNETGEYNCFLNVIIQSLWHIRRFRNVLLAPEAADHMHEGDPCVVCALRGIFLALAANESEEGSKLSVSPTPLRLALSALFADSSFFQEAEMNDASELMVELFDCLHRAFSPTPPPSDDSGSDEDGVPAGEAWECMEYPDRCMAHALFSLDIAEQMECSHCRMLSRRFKYSTFFQNINASSLRLAKTANSGSLMDEILREADQNVQLACDPESEGCGSLNYVHHYLRKAPPVFTTVVGWANGQESLDDISSTLDAIDTEIDVSVIYRGLPDHHIVNLVSVVCYYGQHYHCFAYNREAEKWVMFDDTKVKVMKGWEDVVSTCRRGHLQPQVLIYEKPSGA